MYLDRLALTNHFSPATILHLRIASKPMHNTCFLSVAVPPRKFRVLPLNFTLLRDDTTTSCRTLLLRTAIAAVAENQVTRSRRKRLSDRKICLPVSDFPRGIHIARPCNVNGWRRQSIRHREIFDIPVSLLSQRDARVLCHMKHVHTVCRSSTTQRISPLARPLTPVR